MFIYERERVYLISKINNMRKKNPRINPNPSQNPQPVGTQPNQRYALHPRLSPRNVHRGARTVGPQRYF